MTTVERIKAICKERKIPLARLERDCGFANAYISQLRKGTVPNDRLMKIADYLSVSPAYLSGLEEQVEVGDVVRSDHERKLLLSFRGAGKLTDEEYADLQSMFEATLDVYLKARGKKRQ